MKNALLFILTLAASAFSASAQVQISGGTLLNAPPGGTQYYGTLGGVIDANGYAAIYTTPSPSFVAVSPTVTASTYTAGYSVGGAENLAGLLRNTGSCGFTIKNILVQDTNGSASAHVPYAIFMFNVAAAQLTGTYTDHAAAGFSVADLSHLVHVFSVTYSNYVSPTGTVVGATPVFADVAENEPIALSGTTSALSSVVCATGTGVAYSGTTGVLTFEYAGERN